MATLTDSGPPFTPIPLTYRVQSQNTIKRGLFQKRNGTYVLSIWNEVPSWNPEAGVPLIVPPVTVSVTFARTPSNVTYRGLDDQGHLRSRPVSTRGSDVALLVDDHVSFLTFK